MVNGYAEGRVSYMKIWGKGKESGEREREKRDWEEIAGKRGERELSSPLMAVVWWWGSSYTKERSIRSSTRGSCADEPNLSSSGIWEDLLYLNQSLLVINLFKYSISIQQFRLVNLWQLNVWLNWKVHMMIFTVSIIG